MRRRAQFESDPLGPLLRLGLAQVAELRQRLFAGRSLGAQAQRLRPAGTIPVARNAFDQDGNLHAGFSARLLTTPAANSTATDETCYVFAAPNVLRGLAFDFVTNAWNSGLDAKSSSITPSSSPALALHFSQLK